LAAFTYVMYKCYVVGHKEEGEEVTPMRPITISSITVAGMLALVSTTTFVLSVHGRALATLIA
jgi:hypothetical protein